jgi:hypothetical protein
MALAVMAAMPLAAQAEPGPEGCAVAGGQGQASGTVTEAGAVAGIVGGGSFTVTVTRGSEVQTVSREHAVPEYIDFAFEAGDEISCVAGEGFVVAGKAA